MTQEQFLFGENGDTHRPLMWFALELTKYSKHPVAEFGAGFSSTIYLRNYCEDEAREFWSFDNNHKWASKWGAIHTNDWLNPVLYRPYSVVLIDQGPAEDRRVSIEKLADLAEVIVIHDTEEKNNTSYRFDFIWYLFKYRIFIEGPSVRTAAVSNKINLNQHEGEYVSKFKIKI